MIPCKASRAHRRRVEYQHDCYCISTVCIICFRVCQFSVFNIKKTSLVDLRPQAAGSLPILTARGAIWNCRHTAGNGPNHFFGATVTCTSKFPKLSEATRPLTEMPSAFHASGKASCKPTPHAAQNKGGYSKSTSRTRDSQGISQQVQTTSSTSRMGESDATQRPVHFPHER